jgi:CheY-like chemotaxis protein
MVRILVVDDNALIRESCCNILSDYADISEAVDGLDAISVFQASGNDIPLVLMDINMPRMDGISAARILKGKNPSLRIILMSGYETPPNDLEVNAFISKPFSSKVLIDLVQSLLGESTLAS